MILTCPECATSYFVDEARIPPEGRTVKCAACGARWRAVPEAEAAPEAPAEPEPPAGAEVVAEASEPPEPEPAEPAAPPEDFEIVAEPAPSAARAAARARAAATGRKGPGVAMVAGIAVAALVALAVTGALVFREDVVRLWPASAKAYAGLGLGGDELGLVIDEVKFQPTFQGGRPVLSVTGAIRNTKTEVVTSPALRISLLDRAGKPLAAKLARPLNAEIPAGAKRYFAVAIPDPPAGSQTLEIGFDAEAGAPAPAAEPLEAVLGPAPIEAQPLPPGTPHALPDHG